MKILEDDDGSLYELLGCGEYRIYCSLFERAMVRKEAAERERIRSSRLERIGGRRRDGGRERAWRRARAATAATTADDGMCNDQTSRH
jgi:hypothetical protein